MNIDATRRAARLTTGILVALIFLVVAWQLSTGIDAARIGLAVLLSVPLLLPMKGLVRGDRRTHAWATLCVIPYFILGVTEAIANPAQRAWAAACLTLALTLFVALIAYLRRTRSNEPHLTSS